MIGLYISVPVACFRRGLARDYWESEPLPPPATCYGFLLALVGEAELGKHCGARVTAGLLSEPQRSQVLRTVWRVKKTKYLPGQKENATPIEQELLTGIELALWLDSAEETETPTLEERVRNALKDPKQINRFGGLSLGESTHLVNDIRLLETAEDSRQRLFTIHPNGPLSLPVWVDHIGRADTRFAVGELCEMPLTPPQKALMPIISPV
jgi:CRISPR-associated protein Cas5t